MERNERYEEDKQNERSAGGHERPLKEQSPDEAKETVKEKVSRAVATVAGALEGFAEQMRKNDVPEKSKQAVETVGETTRKVSEATRKEGREVKLSLSSGSESAFGRHDDLEAPMPVTGTAHKEPQAGESRSESGFGKTGESGFGKIGKMGKTDESAEGRKSDLTRR